MRVTGTMIVTTLVLFIVMRRAWGWATWQATLVCALFLFIDSALFYANLHKFIDGGWLPVFIALLMLAIAAVRGERLRFSLKTRDVDQARERRVELNYNEYPPVVIQARVRAVSN